MYKILILVSNRNRITSSTINYTTTSKKISIDIYIQIKISYQKDFRLEINERKEMLALNRHRYDEIVQITNKALTVKLFFINIILLF